MDYNEVLEDARRIAATGDNIALSRPGVISARSQGSSVTFSK